LCACVSCEFQEKSADGDPLIICNKGEILLQLGRVSKAGCDILFLFWQHGSAGPVRPMPMFSTSPPMVAKAGVGAP
jgi:hypothetical protein